MPETPSSALVRRIAEYPQRALPFLQSGFTSASTLREQTLDDVLGEIVRTLGIGKRNIAGIDFTTITGLDARESEQIASAFSVVVGLITETNVAPAEFVDAARGTLFLEKDERTVTYIAKQICERQIELAASLDQAQLAGVILPTVYSVNTTVDVRMKFVAGKLKTHTPVCIVHIDTDTDAEIWFQASRGDLESIVRRLQETLADMELAASTVLSGNA